MPLKFNDYQEMADNYANHSLLPDIELMVLALGLTGEAGEVADLIKKYIGHGHDLDVDKLTKELGDVLWYIAAIATWLNFQFSDIAEINLNKLSQRYPHGFSSGRSINRGKDG